QPGFSQSLLSSRLLRYCHAVTERPSETSISHSTPLAPRLRRSVEGLNLELEEVFVSEKPDDRHEILDIPDGHRAPVPVQRCSSGSQSEPSPGPLDLDPSLLSPSQSPCPLDPSLLSPSNSPSPLNPSLLSPSQSPCPCSSAPRPNKTYSFQREPPEGCERVRVCEEGISACQDEPFLQPSCPDPNKVNFTPHGVSAFCPVSLLKPLLPSMDLLFRGLSVSPVTGCPGQASPTRTEPRCTARTYRNWMRFICHQIPVVTWLISAK
uniref:Family with sequence similarity 117 member A n=1 Tax=Cyclopterus lumpus TaxID=8103 RepID=A0A8C2ZR02_CYCLU